MNEPAFPVVGVGASAGGLEAFRMLLDALPDDPGIAFILVQHLDPHHESMLVELLAGHTGMRVRQAGERMVIEPNNLYVIPPGTDLGVQAGRVHLTPPAARHGARLPFDHLLRSMAEVYGARAACIILSGTGSDGCAGAKAIRAVGGRVIAQDPKEAGYDGMPRSAIAAGVVDQILAIGKIPFALSHLRTHPLPPDVPEEAMKPEAVLPSAEVADAPRSDAEPWLAAFIELLRARTAHDFTLYKPGTLQRRIERRMALAAINRAETGKYLARLRADETELDLLARDLLINVTGFFRDRTVFDHLAEHVIPGMVDHRAEDTPLRIWTAGCSTGEETYSLAMLFMERIEATNRAIKLQVFASDVDAEAVACARDGRYPATVIEDVGAARIARFFVEEEDGYRVRPELRSCVVFTVQDLLSDPPFSRLDMVSCRNLLIYLQPAAQAKVFSLFNFSLREGGVLLLGRSETLGATDRRFDVISKSERIYKRLGRNRPGDLDFPVGLGGAGRGPAARNGALPIPPRGQSREAGYAELCRRLVLESFAPAAVLISPKREVLYSLGPVDRYLRVAPGLPSHDVMAMAALALRTKLHAALHRAGEARETVTWAGGVVTVAGRRVAFDIAVQPVAFGDETLFLICFIETLAPVPAARRGAGVADPRIAGLEAELTATRAELDAMLRNLDLVTQDHKAINEEALSANEEFQSTNEELLTSKEELQSLNEELTALNSQLQETLERQRVTANDLQNVLFSTDVATLFLDKALNIRFFTPATRALFNVIPGDIGRKLADLRFLAADDALLADAASVLDGGSLVDREIETREGRWFVRRILPYRTQGGQTEGVVITFNDITERREASLALDAAKQQAERANLAKSRFLAAASHDLRQPLQALVLIHALLARRDGSGLGDERALELIRRQGQTLEAMSGMLSTLLDLNQIEAGIVVPAPADFALGGLLARLGEEFSLPAGSRNLALRVMPCRWMVHSDPKLLEQMLRNLMSNALKYTSQGRILVGCRRRGAMLSVEVWDTGIGIAEAELGNIFHEYHQIDNAARESFRGLGLGLSIVRRLADLMGHTMRVRSRPGKGSVFAIEIPVARAGRPARRADAVARAPPKPRRGAILIMHDDSEIRNLLDIFLTDAGHRTEAVAGSAAALELVAAGQFRPDLILTDYNLPGPLDGLRLVAALRSRLHAQVPAILLSGDIATGALRSIAMPACVALSKPVELDALNAMIREGLAGPRKLPASQDTAAEIVIVDDDAALRDCLGEVLRGAGRTVMAYSSAEALLDAGPPGRGSCLLLDAGLPGMSGFDLLIRLRDHFPELPVIMMTGQSDVPMAVRAMKAGALDFIEKPIAADALLAVIGQALRHAGDAAGAGARDREAAARIGGLSRRQREVMDLVLAGQPTKTIATALGISLRTVDAHRAAIMARTRATSLPELARLAMAAERGG